MCIRDSFEITPKNLHQTRVLLTMSNGQVVHDAEFGIGDVEKSRAALKADFDSIKTVQSWLQ